METLFNESHQQLKKQEVNRKMGKLINALGFALKCTITFMIIIVVFIFNLIVTAFKETEKFIQAKYTFQETKQKVKNCKNSQISILHFPLLISSKFNVKSRHNLN